MTNKMTPATIKNSPSAGLYIKPCDGNWSSSFEITSSETGKIHFRKTN